MQSRVYKSGLMVPERAVQKIPYIATLHDVLLDTDFCALFDESAARVYILETSARALANHPFLCGPPSADGRYFPMCVPDPIETWVEPFVLLGTDGALNYSHWVMRSLPKLALLEMARVPESLPLLVNGDLTAYQNEYLELLGIRAERLLPAPPRQVIRCAQIVVPIVLRGHPRMRLGIDWLRERLAAVMAPPGAADQFLFVSRKDSRLRALLNESELGERLARLGFRTVVLSTLSVREQIDAFSRARVIVAAHGAGLSNILFAPPDAAIVEITNTKTRHMNDFSLPAKLMGQRHIEIVSDAYPAVQPSDVAAEEHKHHFYVDVEAVVSAVRGVLQS